MLIRQWRAVVLTAFLAIVVSSTLWTGSASARSKKTVLQPSPTPQPLEVTHGPILDEVAAEKRPVPKFNSFELTASSWIPKQITEISRASTTNGYDTLGVPALRARYEKSFLQFHENQLCWTLGLGFFQMKRTGSTVVSGATQPGEQTAQFYSMPIGIDFLPSFLTGKVFSASERKKPHI